MKKKGGGGVGKDPIITCNNLHTLSESPFSILSAGASPSPVLWFHDRETKLHAHIQKSVMIKYYVYFLLTSTMTHIHTHTHTHTKSFIYLIPPFLAFHPNYLQLLPSSAKGPGPHNPLPSLLERLLHLLFQILRDAIHGRSGARQAFRTSDLL